MATNCPMWKSGKCTLPDEKSGLDCSWPGRDYQHCFVYHTGELKSAGASLAEIRTRQDQWLRETPIKKWWQFWK